MKKSFITLLTLLLSSSPVIALADTVEAQANAAAIARDCQLLMGSGPNPNFDDFCTGNKPKLRIPGAVPVVLPGGTLIRVHLAQKLSSSTVAVGDSFGITVIDEVRVRNRLVIPAGAYGVGEIVNLENATSNGGEGKLAMRFDYVYAVDGQKIRLVRALSSTDGENKKGAASTLTLMMFPLFGWYGLFAHNFVRGGEAYVHTATTFPVAVEHTIEVDSAGDDASYAL